jgi:hypothetical protein
MRIDGKWCLAIAVFAGALNGTGYAQALSPDMTAKLNEKAKVVAAWGQSPQIVEAVKAFNASPSPEAAAMVQEKWQTLTVLDPFVRSFGKNPAGLFLKSNKAEWVTEAFVSGKNGCKVAFLSKPTSWCHNGKEKHEGPMKGKAWTGTLEMDDSSGAQQVQVGVPVMDGGRPIGSIVVGVKAASLK